MLTNQNIVHILYKELIFSDNRIGILYTYAGFQIAVSSLDEWVSKDF